jgi:hypothetical protein
MALASASSKFKSPTLIAMYEDTRVALILHIGKIKTIEIPSNTTKEFVSKGKMEKFLIFLNFRKYLIIRKTYAFSSDLAWKIVRLTHAVTPAELMRS